MRSPSNGEAPETGKDMTFRDILMAQFSTQTVELSLQLFVPIRKLLLTGLRYT